MTLALPNQYLRGLADGDRVGSEREVRQNFESIAREFPLRGQHYANGSVGTAAHARTPVCRVYNSAYQAIANVTQTNVTFDTEPFDPDGMHSTSVNTERITCVTPGYYMFGMVASWAAHATGYREHFITVYNAAGTAQANLAYTLIQAVTVAGVATSIQCSEPYPFSAAGWYAKTWVSHSSGGNLNCQVIFSAAWLSAL